MGRVIIGMDPHKRSATIEIIDEREKVLAQGRFGTDHGGYQEMLSAGRRHRDRVWAVEGCAGIGKHIAQRLVADGETVVDVPAKLSARARVFSTGHTSGINAVCAVEVDGRSLLATGSTDATARVWDPATGTKLRQLTGHTSGVTAVCAVEADGRSLLATGSHDATVRVWDPATGRNVSVIRVHHSVAQCGLAAGAIAIALESGILVIDLLF